MRKLTVALGIALVVALGGNIAQHLTHQDFQFEAWKYVSNLQTRLDHPIQHLSFPGECQKHSHDYVLAPWPTTYKQDR